MYYSNGNYEAFAHPRKPEGVDEKSAGHGRNGCENHRNPRRTQQYQCHEGKTGRSD